MKRQKKTAYLFILPLVIAGWALISPAAQAGEVSSSSSKEVQQLLSQVRYEAVALDQDADRLAAMARTSQAHWQTHATSLNVIREHINNAGQLLAQLGAARDQASPWQQQAIDRISPLLKELADNTEATINHFNENKHSIHFPVYRDYAKAGADLASELATLVSDYVEFGEQEAEFHRLQEKLSVTAS